MLDLTTTLSGYCGGCSQPALVGLFELRGWPHKVALCASCLRGKAAEVERKGASLPPANGDER